MKNLHLTSIILCFIIGIFTITQPETFYLGLAGFGLGIFNLITYEIWED